MHPLQVNITGLTDSEIEDKVRELTKKYFTAMKVSPGVANQILMLLEDYKNEQVAREQKRLEVARKDNLDGKFDDLINIG